MNMKKAGHTGGSRKTASVSSKTTQNQRRIDSFFGRGGRGQPQSRVHNTRTEHSKYSPIVAAVTDAIDLTIDDLSNGGIDDDQLIAAADCEPVAGPSNSYKRCTSNTNSSAPPDNDQDVDYDLAEAIRRSQLDDIDDLDLIRAIEASQVDSGHTHLPNTSNQAYDLSGCPGIDMDCAKIWMYPNDYAERGYQKTISERALYENTFVALPTGLGKTLIAAVVMFNFYRWYPEGKILFVAPTRPLVDQQISACQRLVGFEESHVSIMTGRQRPDDRDTLWQLKRVFFLTAETLLNDLQRGSCPAASVRCLVLDEAHRATGAHAYCQCVNRLLAAEQPFRLLALSATPGNPGNIQQIVNNLVISRIESRTEDMIDIQQYVHQRQLDKIVCPLSTHLLQLKDDFDSALKPCLDQLIRARILQECDRDLTNFTAFKARLAMQMYQKRADWKKRHGWAAGTLSFLQSMLHHYDVLIRYGSRSLFHSLSELLHKPESGSAKKDKRGGLRSRFMNNERLSSLWDKLNDMYGNIGIANATLNATALAQTEVTEDEEITQAQELDTLMRSHPKLDKLVHLLRDHFSNTEGTDHESRAIVFAQYRASVSEIGQLLRRYRPIIRPAEFKGQGGAAMGTPTGENKAHAHFARGRTQKQQLEILEKFKSGTYNVLVSTCVGEEGLDVGEVDLIVCYDATSSPGRYTQRIGRTGRQRPGRVVVLVAQGREEILATRANYGRQHVQSMVLKDAGRALQKHASPRMIPPNLIPECITLNMAVPTPSKRTSSVASSEQSTTRKKRRRSSHPIMNTAVIGGVNVADNLDVWAQNAASMVDEAFLTDSQLVEYNRKHGDLSSWTSSINWNLSLVDQYKCILPIVSTCSSRSTRSNLLSDILTNQSILFNQSAPTTTTNQYPIKSSYKYINPLPVQYLADIRDILKQIDQELRNNPVNMFDWDELIRMDNFDTEKLDEQVPTVNSESSVHESFENAKDLLANISGSVGDKMEYCAEWLNRNDAVQLLFQGPVATNHDSITKRSPTNNSNSTNKGMLSQLTDVVSDDILQIYGMDNANNDTHQTSNTPLKRRISDPFDLGFDFDTSPTQKGDLNSVMSPEQEIIPPSPVEPLKKGAHNTTKRLNSTEHTSPVFNTQFAKSVVTANSNRSVKRIPF